MTDTPSGNTLEEAADWLIRLHEADSQELRARHDQWLAASEDNRNAWTKVCMAWSVADAAQPATVTAWPGRKSDGKQPEAAASIVEIRRRKRRYLPYAAALAAACLAIAILPQAWRTLEADYSTDTAEMKTINLPDGSTINLGADSAIAVDLANRTRIVQLLGGRAFFDIAKDETRPFVVQAGDVSVTVLGTAFDVGLGREEISVAVKRGLVGVRYDSGDIQADERVSPGTQLTINRRTGSVISQAFPASEVGTWIDGKLFVENAPISEVLEELRRYHRGVIILADDIGARRVTGFYNLQAPDQAIGAMLLPVGGKVRTITPYLTLISGPSDPLPK
ncbi:FecR domain-containing protein [Ferrovibrio sp.]|uniref:FecR family protein n=1 Tax=Ferrovibrio sp. TaxID=1917215 RepID=UPI00311FF16D